MTDAPLLEIRNVKKYYPIRKTRNGTDLAVKAVDQVSLTVNQERFWDSLESRDVENLHWERQSSDCMKLQMDRSSFMDRISPI